MQQIKWHDVHSFMDGVINTVSGHLINFNAPKTDQIKIDDIINSLANICRFGGHVRKFYSVAQHSVLVAALAPPSLKKAALLHDACEAYLGDVVKPLKVKLGGNYRQLEMDFLVELSTKFNLNPHDLVMGVKQYDKEALTLEHEALVRGNIGLLFGRMRELGLCTDPFIWEPSVARYEFNKVYSTLFDIELERLRWS